MFGGLMNCISPFFPYIYNRMLNMKNLITILPFAWIFNINAQEPLYQDKIKGNTIYIATGTQTVVAGRIFTVVDGNTKPVAGSITIKGYSKEIKISENGNYWVEISELIKSRKKIKVSCQAKNYKSQECFIKFPYTNEYHINFELIPKK